jgi:hypothetical protein
MLILVKKAISARKRLINTGKSKIDNVWAMQFIRNYEYWDANTQNSKELARKKRNELLIIAPPTFCKKLNELLT